MFIDTLQKRFPKRVLKSIHLDYSGFTAYFDVANGKYLKLEIHAYAMLSDQLEIHEIAVGTSHRQVWLNHAYMGKIAGADPLPLLKQWLNVARGGEENGYEGSFAELIIDSEPKR